MVRHALRRQGHGGLRRDGHGGDRRTGAADNDALRQDGLNLRRGAEAAVAARHRDAPDGVGKSQHAAVIAAAVAADGHGIRHGDAVGVDHRGGEGQLRTRQRSGRRGGEIDMLRPPAGGVGRHQQHMVGNGPFAALGGTVDHPRGGLMGQRRHHGGGAAAVQRHRRHAAQLRHAHGHGGQRRADAVARLAAVDGVENQRAVGALADGGTGGRAGGQARLHFAALHQQLRRADELHRGVPGRVALGGHADADQIAGLQGLHRIGIALGGLEIHRNDVLALRHLGVGNFSEHLVHAQRQHAADGQRALHLRADHIDARLAGAGGMPVVEAAVIEEDAVFALADVVEGIDRKTAAAVDDGVDGQLGVADHGRAVGAEAHRVVGVAADVAQHAVYHGGADGNAVGHAVVVAVDARQHAPALPLQLPGGAAHRGEGAGGLAVGDHRLHLLRRGVYHVVFLPQIGVGIAPEGAVRQGDGAVQFRAGGGQVMPQRLAGTGGKRRKQQAYGQRRGKKLLQNGFHDCPPVDSNIIGIPAPPAPEGSRRWRPESPVG